MKMIMATVVVIAVFGLVSAASAAGNAYPIDYSVKGKIVSLDLLKRTLTIKPTEAVPLTAAGEFTFTMNDMTNVRMCEQDKTVQDIRVGDVVTVAYSMKGGKLYADTINIPTPLVACLLDEK